MSGDNIIKFPLRPSAQTLSLDLVDIQGRWIGVHLTPDDEVAVFVEHYGDAVGGLIDLDQARQLRDALTGMLVSAFGPRTPGAA